MGQVEPGARKFPDESMSLPAVMNIHQRMDMQDSLLREIRDMVVTHIAEAQHQTKVDGPVAKALDEIVLLWRASKIIIPAMLAVVTLLWGLSQWWKDHIK